MPKNTVSEIGANSKGMWSSIQEAPWYAPVLISLITGTVIAFKAFLNYLNKKQALQIQEKKHILEYKVKVHSKQNEKTNSLNVRGD